MIHHDVCYSPDGVNDAILEEDIGRRTVHHDRRENILKHAVIDDYVAGRIEKHGKEQSIIACVREAVKYTMLHIYNGRFTAFHRIILEYATGILDIHAIKNTTRFR
jgi:hypothetical protein